MAGYKRLTEKPSGSSSYGSVNQEAALSDELPTELREYGNLCDEITANIFTINNAGTGLEKATRLLGTQKDDQSLRQTIAQVNADAGETIQETTEMLRTANLSAVGIKRRKFQVAKLQSQFQQSATRFSLIQKRALSTVKTARVPDDLVRREMDEETFVSDQRSQQQQVMQFQSHTNQQVEYEIAAKEARAQQVHQLEEDIVDLNEVMRELSSMVGVQGETVTTIEDNIQSTHINVEEGGVELVKASQYKVKKRKMMVFMVLLLIIVVVILVAVLDR